MPVYIRSASCVSPFFPLEGDRTALPAMIHDSEGQRAAGDARRLAAIEPDYSKFVDTKMIRRMSRIVKMGVSAALHCLKTAGDPMPGAIITGTAYGCLEDTGIFLRKMISHHEELLSPTAFIQSTHNTVGAQVALLLKCHSYNNTVVHRALSLEHSLTEARMLLDENTGPVLVGAIDEITADSFALLRRFGLFDRPASLGGHVMTGGYPAGEGAAFFLLERAPSGQDLGVLHHVATAYEPDGSAASTLSWIAGELDRAQFDRAGIGTVLDGSGLLQNDPLPGISHAGYCDFKKRCGEFPTASGFALWMAAIQSSTAPGSGNSSTLIVNRSPEGHNSLILVSPC